MNTVYSILDGVAEGMVVEIQTHLANGLPNLQIIGVVGKSLEESKERIRSSFASCSLSLPRKKITCSISPSDIPKNGSYFDVGIAVSILVESEQIKNLKYRPIVLGELGLDGSIKPIRGIIGKILIAKKKGFKLFIIPKDNLNQALLVPEISIWGVSDLKELHTGINNGDELFVESKEGHEIRDEQIASSIDFNDVIGQDAAKRALEIAAAGRHNVLLSGPPGVGKSMLAKALAGILPPMSRDEIITITHIHSLVSSYSGELVTSRPVRSPHHSTSDIALIGGGQQSKPGEVTLSHGGILFLDEMPEFKRSSLESLRQPLEDKQITVSRANSRVTYPADFLLVATKNPCPCGFLGSSKPCICSPLEIDRYNKKLSGPLLDRIDIHVTVDSVDHTALMKDSSFNIQDSSSSIRQRVMSALAIQDKRFGSLNKKNNSSLNNKEIKNFANLTPEAKSILDEAASKLSLSARVYMKTVKVGRTIADLDNSEQISVKHISEALRYRPIPTS